MAAQSFLLAATATATTAALFAAPYSSARPFHSAHFVAGPGGAAAARALVVADASKKAVAVLKGTSEVEGVVTLTQDDDGAFPAYVMLYLLTSPTFRIRVQASFGRCLAGQPKQGTLPPPHPVNWVHFALGCSNLIKLMSRLAKSLNLLLLVVNRIQRLRQFALQQASALTKSA